jgi:hypothetical protein
MSVLKNPPDNQAELRFQPPRPKVPTGEVETEAKGDSDDGRAAREPSADGAAVMAKRFSAESG